MKNLKIVESETTAVVAAIVVAAVVAVVVVCVSLGVGNRVVESQTEAGTVVVGVMMKAGKASGHEHHSQHKRHKYSTCLFCFHISQRYKTKGL